MILLRQLVLPTLTSSHNPLRRQGVLHLLNASVGPYVAAGVDRPGSPV